MPNEWKKIEMAPTWNGNNEDGSFKLKPSDSLEGEYLGKEEGVGPNEANLYSFRMADRKVISVWGSALLDTRFKNLVVNEEVKIVYLGSVKSEKSGRNYHNFDVFHREVGKEIPVVEEK